MSVQKDKQPLKTSKMPERYARWFGTRVPSTSRQFRYIIMLALAIPWSLLVCSLLSIPFADLTLVPPISFGAGLVIYSLYLYILEIRFRSPIVNEQFSLIVERAHEKAGSHELVHVWQRSSPEPYIASTFNSLFNAVIVSEPMIELILKMPASGEAMLAFHLLHKPGRRNILDIIAATMIFSSFSTYVAFFLLASSSIHDLRFLSIILASTMGYMSVLIILIILLLKSAFWAHDSAFERTAVMYKIHPIVARDEVMSNAKLDDEAAKTVVWVVREWERRKRDGRRLSTFVLVLGITCFVIFSSARVSAYFFPYFAPLYVLSLLATPFLPLSVFLVLRRWDNICMSEIYHETTKDHEPIWVD